MFSFFSFNHQQYYKKFTILSNVRLCITITQKNTPEKNKMTLNKEIFNISESKKAQQQHLKLIMISLFMIRDENISLGTTNGRSVPN